MIGFSELMVLILTAFVSFLVGLFIEKYKNKISYIKKKITHQPIATSHSDNYWGKIKVTYNNQETAYVSTTQIELLNDSNKDIENFNLLITCNDESRILVGNAHNSDSLLQLSLTDSYQEQIEAQNIQYTDKHIEFFINTLNRKTSIVANLLLDSSVVQQPIVNVFIEKKGIKLINYQEIDVEKQGIAILMIGWITFLLVSAIIYFGDFNNEKSIMALILVGSLQLLIGGIAFKVFDFVRNLFK